MQHDGSSVDGGDDKETTGLGGGSSVDGGDDRERTELEGGDAEVQNSRRGSTARRTKRGRKAKM